MKRLTKEQAQNAKKWERYEVDILEECILCWYNQYNWILIIKIPEMVSQCISCAEKYPDDNTKWRAIYIIWSWFIEEND